MRLHGGDPHGVIHRSCVEAAGFDHAIAQLHRRRHDVVAEHERIRAVEGRNVRGIGIGHAQHAADQLLDGSGGRRIADRTKHIGERAIPALSQLVDRDDETHRAFGRHQIRLADLVERASVNLYVLGAHVKLFDQRRLNLLGCLGFTGFRHRLRLNQGNGPDKGQPLLCRRVGNRFQFFTALHCRRQDFQPVAAAFEVDRQLDHPFVFQFQGARGVQNVAGEARADSVLRIMSVFGRRRQLQDEGRAEAGQ